MSAAEILVAELLAHEGVEETTSRYGDFRALTVNGHEFVHLHSETDVELRVTRARLAQLPFDERIAERRPGGDWAFFDLRDEGDLPAALELARTALEANA